MPLDQLEQLLVDQAEETSMAASGYGSVAESIGLEDIPAEAGGEMPEISAEDMMLSADPDTVEGATTVLVEAGLLTSITTDITPELVQVLQDVADQNAPGLYDVLGNEAALVEVLEGVSNGTIPIGQPAADPTIPAVGDMGRPEDVTGLSGAGGPPTGLPGGGTPAF